MDAIPGVWLIRFISAGSSHSKADSQHSTVDPCLRARSHASNKPELKGLYAHSRQGEELGQDKGLEQAAAHKGRQPLL